MLVAATPIEPRDGDKCWAFHVVNDGSEPIERVVLEGVDYEWGDSGNARTMNAEFGPIAPRSRCACSLRARSGGSSPSLAGSTRPA
jgi:hypothetical protein